MIIQNASLAKREGLWNIYIENGIFKKIETAKPVDGAMDVGGKLGQRTIY